MIGVILVTVTVHGEQPAAYLVDDSQLVSHAGRHSDHDRPTSTRVVFHGPHTVRRPEICSRWTAALEQSASQDLPARPLSIALENFICS